MIFLLAVYLFFQLCSHWGYLYFGSDMHYRFLYPLLCITESIMQILVHSYRMFNLVTNFRTKNKPFHIFRLDSLTLESFVQLFSTLALDSLLLFHAIMHGLLCPENYNHQNKQKQSTKVHPNRRFL